MSAHGGKADIIQRQANVRLWTQTGHAPYRHLEPTVGHFSLAAQSESARLDIERQRVIE
jgi:hypothetical protein